MLRYIFLFIFLLHSIYSIGQTFTNQKKWKKQRKQIFIGIGAANFLGDLGGKNDRGKDYSFADLESSLTKLSASIGFNYRISQKLGWRSDLNYLKLSGDDKLTNEKYRHNRNLSFKTNVYELSTNLEYVFSFRKIGNIYNISGTRKKRYKSNTSNLYLSVGIGVFWFNPKSTYGGKIYELQPLGTEGQGLDGNPKKYSRVAVSTPLTIGYRALIRKKYVLSIEYNFRKTFTDYIDDTHGVYYDNSIIKSNRGEVAAYFADPSLGHIAGATLPNADGSGAQRGDRQKDSFMSFQMKIGIILKTKGRKLKF
jgi:hypothetical protein